MICALELVAADAMTPSPLESQKLKRLAMQVDVLATLQRGAWINMLGLGTTLVGLQASALFPCPMSRNRQLISRQPGAPACWQT